MRIAYKIAMISSLLIVACDGGDDAPPTVPTPPKEVVADPKATTLIFPGDNTECNEGVVVDETVSLVTFRWNAAADTDNYVLNLRNISTNQTTTATINAVEFEVAINRGTPYEWFVTSQAAGTTVTADSPKFKFYNQGPGIENYAPFPAEVVNPIRGANVTNSGGTVTLEWKGTDIDDDIATYEVFFGTDDNPTDSVGTTSEVTFDVTVANGVVYYWRIVSTDAQGNTSESEIFEFQVSS